MREVCFLIDEGQNILWSDASNTAVRLPDSRARWEAIWTRRHTIVEIAHSHPVGPLAFSREDETTMAALESALGRSLAFSVVAPVGVVRKIGGEIGIVIDEPWWARLLRLASDMRQ
jgi:hypothetical protein